MMVIYKLELFNYETRNATSIPCLKYSHLKLYNVWGKQIYYHKYLPSECDTKIQHKIS